jgi:hypothetical protein
MLCIFFFTAKSKSVEPISSFKTVRPVFLTEGNNRYTLKRLHVQQQLTLPTSANSPIFAKVKNFFYNGYGRIFWHPKRIRPRIDL